MLVCQRHADQTTEIDPARSPRRVCPCAEPGINEEDAPSHSRAKRLPRDPDPSAMEVVVTGQKPAEDRDE